MNDVANLPKWAQSRISQLERSVEWHKGKVRQIETGDTDVFISDSLDGDIGLPRNSRIKFLVPDGEITCHVGDEGLEIFGSAGQGFYHLAFLPRSANHGVVKVVDR